MKKEGRNQRALDGLKNDARTDSLRLATRCSRMLSAKVKNVTRDGTDLDWENEEDFDVSDDGMRRHERGRPRSRARRDQRWVPCGRPPFRQPRALSNSGSTWARSSSQYFGSPPSYGTSCLLEALKQITAAEKKTLLVLESMSGVVQQQNTNSTTSTSTGSTPTSSGHGSQQVQLASVSMAPSVMHPLPLLGTPGAPAAFEGRNVSSFLKKFEAMCNNFGIDEETKVRRIQEYCEDDIGREVEAFETWKKKDWEGLKDEMRKEWRQGDVEQLMYTRPLLEEYVSKPRGRDGLKQYHRQFNRISTALVSKEELDAYSQGRLFVLGLPECVRKMVLSKDDIGSETATGTVDYEKALKIVRGIVAADERMANFFMRPEKQSEISNLAVAMNEPKPVLAGEAAKGAESGEKGKMQKDQQDNTVAALTESFKALTLPLTAAISELKSAATNPRERPTGGFQGTRLDPALDRRPGARYGRDGRPMICYMCGEEGHTLNRCEHTRRLAVEGQIHLNQENRPCLGPMREGAYPVIKQPNMTLLETIEKLLKMRDPNPLAGVSFIRAVVKDDSDLEVEDIERAPAIAEAFAARADIR